jgi:hypothetical protein
LNNNVSSSGLKPVGDVLDGILTVAFPLTSFFVDSLDVKHNTSIVEARLGVLRTIDIQEPSRNTRTPPFGRGVSSTPTTGFNIFALPEVGKFLL